MFAGLISKEKPVSAWGEPDKILAALAPYSLDKPRDYWATDKHMLLQVNTRNDVVKAEIYRHPESGIAVAFWGRLDNRPDLIAQLDAECKASDDELIALAWLKWGEHCPEKLIGDFAFAVASPKAGVVFLARDVMGVKPLFYRADNNGVFFANSAAAFKALYLDRLTRSEQWIAKFLQGTSFSHTETAYEEINKLAGAHCLLVSSDGSCRLRRYHRFVDNPPKANRRDMKWLDAYRSCWQQAMHCRIPELGAIGSENSGGIDSGSITSELARFLGDDVGRLSCFGYCLEELEPAMIMATAMKYGITSTCLVSEPWEGLYVAAAAESIQINGYPVEHPSSVQHLRFLRSCLGSGIGTLFSGFGGDEAVTNEAGGILHELVDGRDYVNLFKMARGSVPRRLLRTARMALSGYKQPVINASELNAYAQRWNYAIISDTIGEKFVLEQDYLNQASYGQELRRINSEVMYFLEQAYVPTRLESCTLMAAAYGVEYVWPLLDSRLIQQWLATPSIWKAGDLRLGRYLHRRAVAGVCPDAVTWKADKDMGFSKIYQLNDTQSNAVYFKKLMEFSENMPSFLDGIVDSEKMKKIAMHGLKQDVKGYEVRTAMAQAIDALTALNAWH